MLVLDIFQPGMIVQDYSSDRDRTDAESLLSLALRCLDEIAISLELFQAEQRARAAESERLFDRAQWQADRAKQREAEERALARLEAAAGGAGSLGRWEFDPKLRELVSLEGRRELWAAGQIPVTYQSVRPVMHAATFINGLHSLGAALSKLSKIPGAPADVAVACKDYLAALPDVEDVRHSLQHREDRYRVRARETAIDVQPVDIEGAIKSAGGAVFIDAILGDEFATLVADGRLGRVPLTEDVARFAQHIVQRVVNAHQWESHPHAHPQ